MFVRACIYNHSHEKRINTPKTGYEISLLAPGKTDSFKTKYINHCIMITHHTPVERPLIRVTLEDDVARLKKWLELIKIHTEDGNVLALIDLALDNKEPTEEDRERDKAHECRTSNSPYLKVEDTCPKHLK